MTSIPSMREAAAKVALKSDDKGAFHEQEWKRRKALRKEIAADIRALPLEPDPTCAALEECVMAMAKLRRHIVENWTSPTKFGDEVRRKLFAETDAVAESARNALQEE